jgi:hypothetical protein
LRTLRSNRRSSISTSTKRRLAHASETSSSLDRRLSSARCVALDRCTVLFAPDLDPPCRNRDRATRTRFPVRCYQGHLQGSNPTSALSTDPTYVRKSSASHLSMTCPMQAVGLVDHQRLQRAEHERRGLPLEDRRQLKAQALLATRWGNTTSWDSPRSVPSTTSSCPSRKALTPNSPNPARSACVSAGGPLPRSMNIASAHRSIVRCANPTCWCGCLPAWQPSHNVTQLLATSAHPQSARSDGARQAPPGANARSSSARCSCQQNQSRKACRRQMADGELTDRKLSALRSYQSKRLSFQRPQTFRETSPDAFQRSH